MFAWNSLHTFLTVLAADDEVVEPSVNLAQPILLAVVFTILGLGLFALSLWIIGKLTPFSIRKEIEEDQNIALGIIIGSVILGIAIILSAALVG